MAKKSNIVTFDDARTASRRRRANASDGEFARYAGNASSSGLRNSNFVQPKSSRKSRNDGYGDDRNYGYDDYGFEYGYSGELGLASGRSLGSREYPYGEYSYGWPSYDEYGRGDNGFDEYDYDYDVRDYDDPRPSRAAFLRNARTKSTRSNRSNDVEQRRGADEVEDKRNRRRRERKKSRAEKLFAKQYESDQAMPDSQEGAPRAALYEGKMGSSHRKSARMQRASAALPQTAKLNPAGWFSNLNVSARSLKVGTALLCLLLVGVFLYTPAQQYYQSVREHDRLVAEYSIIEERNEALTEQNSALASNAGMEDAVRQRYGYVVGGDQTAVVSGLSDYATDSSRDSDGIEANVLASSVKAPEEWYTPYLDAFFGVS